MVLALGLCSVSVKVFESEQAPALERETESAQKGGL